LRQNSTIKRRYTLKRLI